MLNYLNLTMYATVNRLGGLWRRISAPSDVLAFGSNICDVASTEITDTTLLPESDNVTPFSYSVFRTIFTGPKVQGAVQEFALTDAKDARLAIDYMMRTFWFTAGREDGMGASIEAAAAYIRTKFQEHAEIVGNRDLRPTALVDAGGGCSGLSPFLNLFRTKRLLSDSFCPFQYRAVDQSAQMMAVNKAVWGVLHSQFKGIGHDARVGDLSGLSDEEGFAELTGLTDPLTTIFALTRVLIHLEDGDEKMRASAKDGPATVYQVLKTARKMGAFFSADAKWDAITFQYYGEPNSDALKVLSAVLASGGIAKKDGGMIPNPTVAAKLPGMLKRVGYKPEDIQVFKGVARTNMREQMLGILPVESILKSLKEKGETVAGVDITDELIANALGMIEDEKFELSCAYSVVAAVNLPKPTIRERSHSDGKVDFRRLALKAPGSGPRQTHLAPGLSGRRGPTVSAGTKHRSNSLSPTGRQRHCSSSSWEDFVVVGTPAPRIGTTDQH